jgi:sulfatase modifying factor 1
MLKVGHINAKLGFARGRRLPLLLAASAAALVALLMPAPPAGPDGDWGRAAEAVNCAKGMVPINDEFCIDQFEARTVVIDKPRTRKHKPEIVKGHSPFKRVTGLTVMAVSEKGKVPQGHISQEEAAEACFNAGKRLCSDEEWVQACQGKKPTLYPYGDSHEEGRCNDKGVSGFNLLFGPGNNTPPEQSAYTVENMNDPRLNQVEGSLAVSGFFSKCKNGFKVYDMVGNLHEWIDDSDGTFRGGYYMDTSHNGEGCSYATTAHDFTYHDYSTGFRCCMDPDGVE